MSISQLQLTHTLAFASMCVCVFALIGNSKKRNSWEKPKKDKETKYENRLIREAMARDIHTHTQFITHTCVSVCVYSKCEQSFQIKPRNVTNAQLANLNRIERSHKLELGLGHFNVRRQRLQFLPQCIEGRFQSIRLNTLHWRELSKSFRMFKLLNLLGILSLLSLSLAEPRQKRQGGKVGYGQYICIYRYIIEYA